MSFKRALLCFLMTVSVLAPSVTFAFDDVPASSPNFYAIEYLRRNDVFQNTKTFRPELVINKAEFVKYLVLLNNPDYVHRDEAALPFTDTRNNAWYSSYFAEAIRLGIMESKAEKAEPYRKLTILEALELLFHSRHIPIPRRWVGTTPYRDIENRETAKALVMRAIELGLIQPEAYDNVGIYRRVTREKAAYMIYKMDLVDLRDPKQVNEIGNLDPSLQKFIAVWDLIKGNYLKRADVDESELTEKAISALVDSLEDPYSSYMNTTQNSAFSDELDGEIEGIGAFVGVNEKNEILIVSPIQGSPAFHAGVKAGDIVRKVDGWETADKPLHEVVSRIKGPRGSTVTLTLERAGSPVVIGVKRDVITIDSVQYDYVGGGDIIHIKLLNFNQNAVKDFAEVAEIVKANPAIKGVILDVRNNPGGLLDVAIGILGNLLPKESVAVNIRYNYFNYSQMANGEGLLKGYPLAVMINKGSASASEIVAGALKDYGVATVVGETSFGKGTVQEVNYFNDASSIKLTVAEWLTPMDHSIQGNGIEPDVVVVQPENTTEDRQLNKAVELLHQQIRKR